MFNEQSTISKWIAHMYDQYITETSDIDFLLSVIGQNSKRVLEIACGSGRILVPMAKAGHSVTGLDFDEYMLNKIHAKAEGLENITWRKADIIRDDWENDFDIVVLAANILFNIISDIDYEQAQQLLVKKAADALIPGGSIYIDYGYTAYPEKLFNYLGEHVVWDGKDSEGNAGRMVLLESVFDKERSIISFTRRFELTLADGNVIRQDIRSSKHFASLGQIREWLSAAEFVIEEEYGDYNRSPISDRTDRAIIWAKKHD